MDRQRIIDTYNSLVAEGRDGFLLNLAGEEIKPTTGYAVGVDPRVRSVSEAVEHVRVGQYIGFWKDPHSQATFTDIVIVIEHRSAALFFALLTGELAVFDFENDYVIYTRDLHKGTNDEEAGVGGFARGPVSLCGDDGMPQERVLQPGL